jgi:hypothetical protein
LPPPAAAAAAAVARTPGSPKKKPVKIQPKKQPKKQIEFYFSDSNLPKDKFLRAQAEAHPDGLVDLSLLLSFSRMRTLLGVSCRSFGAAAAAPAPAHHTPKSKE